MGGGKETPRQKMISMMYIVLTALLALNVSKQILEAYIAIEENIQLANISESSRGNEKWMTIEEKANSSEEKNLKAIEIFKLAQLLDKVAAEQIQLLDEAKLATLKELQEPHIEPFSESKKEVGVITDERVKSGKIKINLNGEKPVITFTGGKSREPLPQIVPIRMNLRNVKGADKYDEGMRIMGLNGDGSLKSPSEDKYGMKIWNGMISYRGKLIDIVCKAASVVSNFAADSGNVGVTYKFKDPLIGSSANKTLFVSPADIPQLLEKKGAFGNLTLSDAEFVGQLYASLCKNDLSVDEETKEEYHWIGRTFDHAPGVAVLAALSSMQKEVLKARSDVMIYLQDKVGGSDYSFDKVKGLARPFSPIVAGGSEFFVEIQAAAYDSQREPEIDTKGQGQVVSIKDGVALVKFRAPSSGEMKISGTVTIKTKSDVRKPLEYNTVVAVAPKSGALELPEVNVLYKNYNNIIVPSAPGVTDLVISGCTRTTYNGKSAFICRPSTPGIKKLSLTGKGPDGKTVTIGSWDYKVKNMPQPAITSTTIPKSGGRISAGLPGGVLNVSFTIINVKCEDFSGAGNLIPGSALAKVRVGKDVGVVATVKNNSTNEIFTIRGACTVK